MVGPPSSLSLILSPPKFNPVAPSQNVLSLGSKLNYTIAYSQLVNNLFLILNLFQGLCSYKTFQNI